MDEITGLLGKLVPFLVFIAIMAIQAWLRVKKQQQEKASRTPAPDPGREHPAHRSEPSVYAPAKRQEWSRPSEPHPAPRRAEPAPPAAKKRDDSPIPIGAAASSLSRRRLNFVFNRGKLREAILHREILTPRYF